MIQFTVTIEQFEEKGEKSGWTYITIPSDIAVQLQPGKVSFRVQGKLDDYAFEGVSLLPMGGGNFIMPLNATIRKAIRKRKGAKLNVHMQADHKPPEPPAGFMESLKDEPGAMEFFNSLPGSHRNYFMKWIMSAKTDPTRIKRIAQVITALSRRQDYGTMIRSSRDSKNDLLS